MLRFKSHPEGVTSIFVSGRRIILSLFHVAMELCCLSLFSSLKLMLSPLHLLLLLSLLPCSTLKFRTCKLVELHNVHFDFFFERHWNLEHQLTIVEMEAPITNCWFHNYLSKCLLCSMKFFIIVSITNVQTLRYG